MYNPGAVIAILLLFCNRVIFTGASFLTDRIVPNDRESIFEKFVPEYKVHMEKFGVRDLVVFALSEEQLRRKELLLEDVPHSFGTDAARLCSAEWITKNTIIVTFLDDLKDRRLKSKIKDLSRCYTRRVHLVFESSSTMNFEDVEAVLKLFATKINKTPYFIHGNDTDNSVKVYGRVTTKDCSLKTRLITDWRPGDGIRKLDALFEPMPSTPCSLIVATVHNPPWMVLQEHATGGMSIAGGYEGKIILEFAKNFNYTVTVQNMKVSDHGAQNSTEAIIASCAAGNANIGIGQIRMTKSVRARVYVSLPYTRNYLVWCIPRIVTFRKDPLFFEFSWTVWMSIGIMFLGSVAVEWLVRNRIHPNRGVVRRQSFVRIILDIVGAALGNPIVYRPISIGGKALLVIYICYSMVMTTAYRSSLSSMLTAGNLEPSIVDVAGIIEANLTTGGDELGLTILEDQRNESKWGPELIRRYVIERNISKALRRVSEDKDFAFFTSIMDLQYHEASFEKSGEHIQFDVIDNYASVYDLVAVFPLRGIRQLKKNFDRSVEVLLSNGLLASWSRVSEFGRTKGSDVRNRGLGMINSEEELRLTTRKTVFYVTAIYLVIMGLSILVFLGELIVHKYRSTRRNRRLDNLNLFKISRRLPLRSASRRSD